jgi:N,N'-diacetylchitobiose transport system permease protein
VGINLVGLLVFAVMVFPVYWMVSTAFKRGEDIVSFTPKWFPIPATLENFSDAIHRPYFWNAVENSLVVGGVVVGLSLVLAFLAALALAKFRFYGRAAFVVLIIVVQMVPLNALIIPLYVSLARVGEVNKLTGRHRHVPDVRAPVRDLDPPRLHARRARGSSRRRRWSTGRAASARSCGSFCRS